jgi:signal transduction histidine kinase
MMSAAHIANPADSDAHNPGDYQDAPPCADPAAEIASLKAQLREAQKLAAMGTVAATLAHEYNNVLTPVVSYAQFALSRDDVELMRKTLGMVLRQFEVVHHMSDRMLGMARHSADDFETVPLNEIIDDAVICMGRTPDKDGIRVVLDVATEVTVHGNRTQLQQVFFNLFLNARHAMQENGGTLKVSATPLSEQAVTVHVRDTGSGIHEDHLSRIFDAFFTTKSGDGSGSRRGIGLGLPVCREIILEHHGQMNVESVRGRGTTFTITLPTIPQA